MNPCLFFSWLSNIDTMDIMSYVLAIVNHEVRGVS